MKKKLILVFLGVFLLCGCEAKIDSKFTINDDKSMNIEMFMGFDDEFMDYMMDSNDDESDITEEDENIEEKEYTDKERLDYIRNSFKEDHEQYNENQAKGFIYKEYQDEKYTGYIVSKEIDSIDNLVGTPNFNLNELTEIDSKKLFEKDGNVYKAKIVVGELEDTTTGDGEEDINLGQMGNLNFITYTFTLKLPNKAINSNATNISEDGKTLTWDLSKGAVDTIEFEFEFPTLFTYLKSNMILTAGIAVVIVLAIVILITALLKKGKNKSNTPVIDILKENASQSVMKKNNNVTAIEQPQMQKNVSENQIGIVQTQSQDIAQM